MEPENIKTTEVGTLDEPGDCAESIYKEKLIGGIGAILMLPIVFSKISSGYIGFIGLILILISLYKFSSIYKKPSIFYKMLVSDLLIIISFIILYFAIFRINQTSFSYYYMFNGENPLKEVLIYFDILGFISILSFIFFIASIRDLAIYSKNKYFKLSANIFIFAAIVLFFFFLYLIYILYTFSNNPLFNISNQLGDFWSISDQFNGLTIVFIGFMIIYIAGCIFLITGFFSLPNKVIINLVGFKQHKSKIIYDKNVEQSTSESPVYSERIKKEYGESNSNINNAKPTPKNNFTAKPFESEQQNKPINNFEYIIGVWLSTEDNGGYRAVFERNFSYKISSFVGTEDRYGNWKIEDKNQSEIILYLIGENKSESFLLSKDHLKNGILNLNITFRKS